MKKIIHLSYLLFFTAHCFGQDKEPFEMSEEWTARIETNAPSEPTVKVTEKRQILVFSQATGFAHWTIPHNNEMLKILAKKTGAFGVHIRYDISNFDEDILNDYDAVVLNNSNPKGPKRDLFYDLLQETTTLSEKEIIKMAAKYEQNLIDFVENGGGLMILHGAIVVQNNSPAFSKMTGGSFDYHPKQQEMHVREVDKNHPMVKAFKGKGLTHTDEPYFFKNAYFDYNFRPLLYMEVDKLEGLREEVEEEKVYVSWIKRHGKGRVFYTSPSHNAQSLENPDLLQYLLDGVQYVTGDLLVNDSPIQKQK